MAVVCLTQPKSSCANSWFPLVMEHSQWQTAGGTVECGLQIKLTIENPASMEPVWVASSSAYCRETIWYVQAD
eukprot:1243118-Amphidinium_carterae.1